MNIIKIVTVFVMGVVVIGVVATTIGVVTQTKNVEKSITFELLDNNKLAFNVHEKINEYAIYNDENYADNLVSVSVNNDYNIFGDVFVEYLDANIVTISNHNENPYLELTSNTYSISGSLLNVGDTITVTFDVEVKTPVIIKTLILLIPLILSASLIGYLAYKKGDE